MWANHYIEKLRNGEEVSFRPRGNSMNPHIKSGQLVKVAPVLGDQLKSGDIVLATVNSRQYLHFLSAIEKHGDEFKYTISNAKGFINGKIGFNRIHGILVEK